MEIEVKGIKIVNLRHVKATEYDYRVDRNSPLGNPYHISRFAFRKTVCAQFRNGWDKMVENKNKKEYFDVLVNHYKETGHLILACWCAPLPCHAEVIREKILEACK